MLLSLSGVFEGPDAADSLGDLRASYFSQYLQPQWSLKLSRTLKRVMSLVTESDFLGVPVDGFSLRTKEETDERETGQRREEHLW